MGVSDNDYNEEITVSMRRVSTFIFGTAKLADTLGFHCTIHVKCKNKIKKKKKSKKKFN